MTCEQLFRTIDLDLKICVDHCKAAETVKIQAQQITSFSAGECTGVNEVRTKKGRKYVPSKAKAQTQTSEPKNMGNGQHLLKSVLNVDYKAISGNAVKQKKLNAVDKSDSSCLLEESDCVELFTESVQVHSVH